MRASHRLRFGSSRLRVGCAPAQPALTGTGRAGPANLTRSCGAFCPQLEQIFDTQDTDPARHPPSRRRLDPYAGLTAVEAIENASMALAEAANLNFVPGRVCQTTNPALDDPFSRRDWPSCAMWPS